jgi:predicted dienelactone hydrolase
MYAGVRCLAEGLIKYPPGREQRMHLLAFAFATTLCFAGPFAQAAGFRFIEVPADASGPALKGAVWYPCATSAGKVKLNDKLSISATMDCPIEGSKLPLVVISTGGNGWFANHHDTAEVLADAGFVTAAISHPGFTSPEKMILKQNVADLIERPVEVKRLVDYMLGTWPFGTKIDSDRIGLFGFSRGGYTGLVTIGGNPDFRRGVALAMCPPEIKSVCDKVWMAAKSTPGHDPRIKAAVLADPAFVMLFSPSDLKTVTIPIQLWASASGGEMVMPGSVEVLERELQSRSDYHVVAGSTHYSFLPPCSPEEKQSQRPSCVDPPGFDRTAFHVEFNTQIVAFFRSRLIATRLP